MRPKNLKTKIFLDSGDPEETKKIIKTLGFLDGQTTNPTLVTKHPEAIERILKGKKFTKKEMHAFYKKIVQEISRIMPQGSVSVEVYADFGTSSRDIIDEARLLNTWVPNAHIKLPIIKEGLLAANQAVKENININMTLCFNQEQAHAVYAATKGAKKGSVFISPFIGRLDDLGQDGLSLISNILKSYEKEEDGHVEVLAASVRNLPHLLSVLSLKCDIVTAPYSVLIEWAENGFPLSPGESKVNGLKKIPYHDKLFPKNWKKSELEHDLTRKGVERFCSDWNALIE